MVAVESELSDRLLAKVCVTCGKTFYTYSKRAKYCSIQCSRKAYNESLKSPQSLENKKKRRRAKKIPTIKEVVIRAEEVGMSYGEYVAKMGVDDDLSGI